MFYGIVRLVFFLATSRTQRWTRIAARLACAAGICAPVYLAASTGATWPSQTDHLVITGARVVDAASNRIVDGQSVYVAGGRIVEIGADSAHPGWPRGRYLLPGLIDVHTHLQSPVEMSVGFRFGCFMKSMVSGYGVQRSQYLASGVTSVRRSRRGRRREFPAPGRGQRQESTGTALLHLGPARDIASRTSRKHDLVW